MLLKSVSAAALSVGLVLALMFGVSDGNAQIYQTSILPTTSSSWRELSAAEVMVLALGHEFGSINRFGEPAMASHKRDGSAIIHARTHVGENPASPYRTPGSVVTDTGTWRLEGNRLCRTMSQFSGGGEQCSAILTDGSNYRRKEPSQYVQPEIYLDAVPWNGIRWTWQTGG